MAVDNVRRNQTGDLLVAGCFLTLIIIIPEALSCQCESAMLK